VNSLYEVPLQIAAGPDGSAPEGMDEAVAMISAPAPDHELAIRKAVEAVQQMGHQFIDLPGGEVYQIPVDQWTTYVDERYDFFRENLPAEAALPAIVESGEVFFGPFLGYPKEEAKPND